MFGRITSRLWFEIDVLYCKIFYMTVISTSFYKKAQNMESRNAGLQHFRAVATKGEVQHGIV